VQQIKKYKNEMIKSFNTENSYDLPTKFLEIIMEISYTGDHDLALQLADGRGLRQKKDSVSLKQNILRLYKIVLTGKIFKFINFLQSIKNEIKIFYLDC
jgi:hypothetical protein